LEPILQGFFVERVHNANEKFLRNYLPYMKSKIKPYMNHAGVSYLILSYSVHIGQSHVGKFIITIIYSRKPIQLHQFADIHLLYYDDI